jgi:hypothetical protein
MGKERIAYRIWPENFVENDHLKDREGEYRIELVWMFRRYNEDGIWM